MLRITNLGKSYGSARVLSGIDLDVQPHDVVAIIGPSGSGKSTLLKCINFLERYDEGEVRFGDELVGYVEANGQRRLATERQTNRLRAEMGMVFQNFNLFPHMTTLQDRKSVV